VKEDLFQPSLTEEYELTKSFNLGYLALIGFFGGVVPVLIMGKLNARWLKVDGILINLLMVLGILILAANTIVTGLYTYTDYEISSRLTRIIFRVASVVLALLFARVMKPAYIKHLAADLPITPMMPYVIGSILLSIIVGVSLSFAMLAVFKT